MELTGMGHESDKYFHGIYRHNPWNGWTWAMEVTYYPWKWQSVHGIERHGHESERYYPWIPTGMYHGNSKCYPCNREAKAIEMTGTD